MDGTSAFNTRTARGRLLLIDPARGEEKLRGKLQQHDDMVVMELVVLRQGFAKRYGGGGRGVGEGEGLRQARGAAALSLPHYI